MEEDGEVGGKLVVEVVEEGKVEIEDAGKAGVVMTRILEEVLFKMCMDEVKYMKWRSDEKRKLEYLQKQKTVFSIKHKREVFGHYESLEQKFACDNCNRIVSSVRYTSHLERCANGRVRRKSKKKKRKEYSNRDDSLEEGMRVTKRVKT